MQHILFKKRLEIRAGVYTKTVKRHRQQEDLNMCTNNVHVRTAQFF